MECLTKHTFKMTRKADQNYYHIQNRLIYDFRLDEHVAPDAISQ